MRHPTTLRPRHKATRTRTPRRHEYGLAVLIDGAPYRVDRLAPDDPDVRRAFRLTRPDGTAYDVAETVHGGACDCPDFVFRRDGLDPAGCKHLQALRAAALLPTVEGPAGPTARELAARHACGTIAETAAGCFYIDGNGTAYLQPHPTGREEDDLPDRERVAEMVWDYQEERWIAEPRGEGHDLDMHAWDVVEDVARDWASNL